MTEQELRDQLAMAAMQGQCASCGYSVSAGVREAIAKFAYLMADAMLEARKK